MLYSLPFLPGIGNTGNEIGAVTYKTQVRACGPLSPMLHHSNRTTLRLSTGWGEALCSFGQVKKVFRLANSKIGKPLSDNKMMKVRRFLKHFTVEQRIRELGLRPDRADVIIPALDIYLKIMKWAGIRKIYVPQIGLADGIVRILYKNYKTSL
jgi:hypothetical protein